MSEVKKKILAVDDDPNLLFGLRALFKREGYEVQTASDGEEGLRLATATSPDLIVCDIRMPVMNGFELLQRLRWDSRTVDIPFVFLTASDEHQDLLSGYAKGADDYIVKPFDPPELLARVNAVLRRVNAIQARAKQTSRENLIRLVISAPFGTLLVDKKGVVQFANVPAQDMLGANNLTGKSLYALIPTAWHPTVRQYLTGEMELPNETLTFETEMARFTGEKFLAQISAVFVHWQTESEVRFTIRDSTKQKQTEIDLEKTRLDLLNAYEATLVGWARALELRDRETQGHSERVTKLTVEIARAMGVLEDEIVHMRRGALLHDIGKIGIPDSILLKPGVLTAEEWVVMRQHPQFALDLLANIEYLRPALDIPYCHHEKWDGTGYPRGLKGEEIPLAARIFAVVDVWDALTSDRPYRRKWQSKETIEAIRNWSSTHFDPMVVDVILQILENDYIGE